MRINKVLIPFWVCFAYVSFGQGLPLQSVDLRAQLIDNKSSNITWKILNQINYLEFEIERKKDNQTDWTSIATLAAGGYSENEVQYNYIDNFQSAANKIYYRIKILATDGLINYSPIRILLLNTQRILLFGYPNPTSNYFELNIQSKSEEKISLQVFDMLGRVVSKETLFLEEGINTKQFNFSELQTGRYYIKASGSAIQETVSMFKIE